MQGQPLFHLRRKDLELEIEKENAKRSAALAELQAAEIELKCRNSLHQKEIISSVEVERAEAALAVARARVAESEAEISGVTHLLALCEIRAPFNGTVGRFQKREGSLLEPGDVITTLTDLSEILAYFRVPERERNDLEAPASDSRPSRIMLELPNASAAPLEGGIDARDPEVSQSTGTITYRARFPNSSSDVLPGSTGRVVFERTISDALLVPQQSTFEVQDLLYVFVLRDGNRLERRAIKTGLRLRDHYVVQSGLESTDRVVVGGIQMVHDGELVEAHFRRLEEVAPLR